MEDQQLGCLWLKNAIISVSLAGFIYYLDPANPSKPSRIVKGHNKPITALSISADKRYLFTGDFEGNVSKWTILIRFLYQVGLFNIFSTFYAIHSE